MSEKKSINKIVQYLTGEYIFQEGQPSENFYAIMKGEVEVSIKKDGKRFIIGMLGPGEFFGEMGLISNEPRSASCRAASFVEVAQINNDDFKKVLKSAHPLTGKIINVLLSRIRKLTSHSIDNNATVNTLYAIANLLDLNFKSSKTDSIFTEIFIRQVTATIGLLPHQTKNILQQLCDFGLIRIERKGKLKGSSSTLQDDDAGESKIYLVSKNLLEASKSLQERSDKLRPDSISLDFELMEINEALELFEVDRKRFYTKMCSADFPDDLFFINKPVFLEILKHEGKRYFETRTIKDASDISSLDDMVFIDKQTLQIALQEIEPYAVAKLIKSASPDTGEMLMACFSSRMKGIIENTIDKVTVEDDLEIQNIERSFIETVKKLKKLRSS